jgi:hypothetical protein
MYNFHQNITKEKGNLISMLHLIQNFKCKRRSSIRQRFPKENTKIHVSFSRTEQLTNLQLLVTIPLGFSLKICKSEGSFRLTTLLRYKLGILQKKVVSTFTTSTFFIFV